METKQQTKYEHFVRFHVWIAQPLPYHNNKCKQQPQIDVYIVAAWTKQQQKKILCTIYDASQFNLPNKSNYIKCKMYRHQQ